MPAHPATRIEAIERALDLLLALSDAGESGESLADLSDRCGINKSTAYRALATMKARGFVAQDDANAPYRLGPLASGLGPKSLAPDNLSIALHPALVALSQASAELTHLGVLAGNQILYADKVEPARSIRVVSAVGKLVPVATTAMGRALLAARNLSPRALDVYADAAPGMTEESRHRFHDEIGRARVHGYAFEHEENEPGIACIGTALMHEGRATAALSITAPADRMTSPRKKELASLFKTVLPPLLPEGFSISPALLG